MKQKNKFSKLIFLISIISVLSIKTLAQSSITEFNEKIKLENSISEKLKDTLSTRISPKEFNIEVDVKLMFISKNLLQNENQKNSKNNLQAQAFVNNIETYYEIEKVSILLQVSDQVSQNYKAELDKWLTTWTRNYFGEKGTSTVSNLVQDQTAKTPLKIEDNTHPVLNILFKMQNLIGMIFIGLILFTMWILNRKKDITPISSSDSSNELSNSQDLLGDTTPKHLLGGSHQNSSLKNQIEIKNDIHPNTELLNTPDQNKPVFVGADRKDTLAQSIAHLTPLQSKLSVLIRNMPEQSRNLMSFWLSADHLQYLKAAAFIEAWALGMSIVSERENSKFLFPIPKNQHEEFQKAVIQWHDLGVQHKIKLTQEIYNELLSESLIDRKDAHYQFDFINQIHDAQLRDLFLNLSINQQITFLMKAPRTITQRTTKVVEKNVMTLVLKQSHKVSEATEVELFEKLQSWKQSQVFKSTEAKTDIAQKLTQLQQVWSVLPRKEEALWLDQIQKDFPELTETLPSHDIHINAIKNWEPEKLKKFCLKLKTRDLAAAIRSLPHLENTLLSVCGESMKNDILHETQTLEERKVEQLFESFLAAYDKFIEQNQPQNINDSSLNQDLEKNKDLNSLKDLSTAKAG